MIRPRNWKYNVIANFCGQFWNSFSNFAFVPVYISFMGIESYGLVGLYSVIQTCFALLDFGMTPALSREATLLAQGTTSVKSFRELLKSIEYVITFVSIAMWAILFTCAVFWFSPDLNKTSIDANQHQIIAIALA